MPALLNLSHSFFISNTLLTIHFPKLHTRFAGLHKRGGAQMTAFEIISIFTGILALRIAFGSFLLKPLTVSFGIPSSSSIPIMMQPPPQLTISFAKAQIECKIGSGFQPPLYSTGALSISMPLSKYLPLFLYHLSPDHSANPALVNFFCCKCFIHFLFRWTNG